MGAWTAQGKWERLLIILEHSRVRDAVGGENATVLMTVKGRVGGDERI